MKQTLFHTGPMKRRFVLRRAGMFAACLCVCLQSTCVFALEIKQVLWGYDGTIVANRFNLLSIEIDNNSGEAFEGSLSLRKSLGGTASGAVLVEDVYVGPFARKWVQFHPYVRHGMEEWRLAVTRDRRQLKSLKLKAVKTGPPARVALVEADNPFAGGTGGLKRFPEAIFPPMVTATDTLAVAVLDHSPRWQTVRARAFIDWLHRGGIVHVCHNAEGTYPVFPESLAALNTTIEKTRVGSGFVIRHPRRLSAFDEKFVRDTILEMPVAMKPTDEPNPNEEFSDGAIDSIVDESGGSDGFFSQLRQMTLPEHSWGVIHLMSIGYILLIFPGCYLLFRRRANYKVTYGALLGVVLVSSFGFRAIGRRGYGESTAVNTVAIARPLGDGYYDVTQWSNVFVIDGADYRITHGGIGRLYSTDQEHEQVEGIIDNGVEGAFTVDIPPYSNRSFVHRQKVKGKPVRLVVEEWEADETLNSLKLTAGDSLPEPTGTIYALFKNRLYELSNIKGRLALKSGPRPLTGSLNIDRFDERAYLFYESESRKHVSPAETYARLRDPLIAAGLGVVGRNQLSTFSLPDDRVRIFLYTKAGDAFFAAGDRLGRQSGYVLFCIDVFKPEKP